MPKETIVFQTSVEFKELIATKAQEQKISVGELIRQCLAEALGYDLDDEPSVERRRKYATKAERDKAMRERAKDRRQQEKAIIEELRQASKAKDIAGMREYLTRKGVTSDAE